ncbi:MAG TPA: carboxypeptidase-like regulatory domain-containing protein [Mucilaginibacter sp.]|jgi:hypothetical protein
MKKIFFLILGFTVLIFQNGLAQCDSVQVNGLVKDQKDKSAIPFATVYVKGKKITAVSKENGGFSIKICLNDSLTAAFIGYTPKTIKIDKSNLNIEFYLTPNNSSLNEVVVTGAISYKSYWSGATMSAMIGYNVSTPKSNSNNIVGGATVMINPMADTYLDNTEFAIIGNIANFLNSKNPNDQTGNDLSKLAQDNNGLSVGLGGTHEFNFGRHNELTFRMFLYSLYQLNSYKVGADTTNTSLSQWKNTFGLEFEGFRFKQGGVIQMGVAANYGIFDSNAYQKIFGAKKSSITSLETSLILPLSNQFGFLFSGTYSRSFKPVFLLGIIVKTIDFSKKNQTGTPSE